MVVNENIIISSNPSVTAVSSNIEEEDNEDNEIMGNNASDPQTREA